MAVAPDHGNIEKLRNEINLYFHKTSRREPSHTLASRILKYFRDIINYGKYKNGEEMVEALLQEGELLYSAHSSEFLIRNVLMMVLKLLREESIRLSTGDEASTQTDSLNRLWLLPTATDTVIDPKKLKRGVLQAIEEFKSELDHDEISSQATHHILYSDTIMTFKFSESSTLKNFFANVKAKTLYSVDDVDTAEANVISSIDILPIMKVSTRVVLSAAAILPDGSCVASAGTLNICLAAKRHSVPVLFVASFYKLTPMFIPHLDEFNAQGAPTAVLPASDALKFSNVFVANPLFDRIPSNLISLFITQTSAVSPSHVYQLFPDYYLSEDFGKLNR